MVKVKMNLKGFMEDLEKLCRKYDLSISHEDYHGGFIIEPFTEYNMEWVKDARFEKTYKTTKDVVEEKKILDEQGYELCTVYTQKDGEFAKFYKKGQ